MHINGTDLRAVSRGISPLTNITPFTYRDGLTFERLLYMIKDYMLDTMEPHFESEISRVIEEFNSELTRIETQYGKDHANLTETVNDFIERIEEYVRTWVDPVAKAAVKKYLDDYVNDPDTLTLFNGRFASRVTEDTARKQSALYGEFFSRLRTGLPVAVCALGDSTTYGYDMVSSDRQPAPKDVMPDGSIHYRDRTPRPYPLVMETRLKEVYGAENISVINRGYSGDTARSSYNRWTTGHGAGLTMLSLGINDSGSLSTLEFIENFEKIVLREINEYDSAVIILTPFKQSSSSPSHKIDAYRSALYSMANKYGVPVVDAETWLSGYDSTYFSDNTHMNTKGYEVIGTRAAALLVGAGPLEPLSVGHGSRLGVRPTIDNLVYGANAGIFTIGGESSIGTPREGIGVNGSMFAYMLNGALYYSFFTEIADLDISLAYAAFAGSQLTVSLDFGIEQADNLLDELSAVPRSHSSRSPSVIEFPVTVGTNIATTHNARYSSMLRVVSPGWHTLKVSTTIAEGGEGIRFMALEFLSDRTFNPPMPKFPLTLEAGVTGIYTQSYYKSGGQVFVEGGVGIANMVAGEWRKVAVLPAGFRPTNLQYFPTTLSNPGSAVSATVRVTTAGDIEVGATAPTGAAVMLNSIHFIPAL